MVEAARKRSSSLITTPDFRRPASHLGLDDETLMVSSITSSPDPVELSMLSSIRNLEARVEELRKSLEIVEAKKEALKQCYDQFVAINKVPNNLSNPLAGANDRLVKASFVPIKNGSLMGWRHQQEKQKETIIPSRNGSTMQKSKTNRPAKRKRLNFTGSLMATPGNDEEEEVDDMANNDNEEDDEFDFSSSDLFSSNTNQRKKQKIVFAGNQHGNSNKPATAANAVIARSNHPNVSKTKSKSTNATQKASTSSSSSSTPGLVQPKSEKNRGTLLHKGIIHYRACFDTRLNRWEYLDRYHALHTDSPFVFIPYSEFDELRRNNPQLDIMVLNKRNFCQTDPVTGERSIRVYTKKYVDFVQNGG